MDLLALLNGLLAQLSDVQAAADALAKLNYAIGFAAGVESKAAFVFTQADLDAKQAELDAVKAELEALKNQPPVDAEKKFSQADLDAAVAAAVELAKSDLKAAFKSLAQVEELDLESKIEGL